MRSSVYMPVFIKLWSYIPGVMVLSIKTGLGWVHNLTQPLTTPCEWGSYTSG